MTTNPSSTQPAAQTDVNGPPSATVLRRRSIDIGDLTVPVVSSGDPADPPLLLIGGLGVTTRMWGPVRRRAGQRHVLMFDLPRVSRRHALPQRRLPGLAQLVTELLDALNVTRADVLGYSWGGALSQQLAVTSPDRVDRLVLVATNYGIGSVPVSAPAVLRMLQRQARVPPSTNFFVRTWPISHPGLWRHPWPENRAGLLLQLGAFAGWSSLPFLHRIDAPTLLVVGDDDPLIPVVNARLMAAAIPNAELQIVPKAGHLLLVQEAPTVMPLINAFLDRSTGKPPPTNGKPQPRTRKQSGRQEKV